MPITEKDKGTKLQLKGKERGKAGRHQATAARTVTCGRAAIKGAIVGEGQWGQCGRRAGAATQHSPGHDQVRPHPQATPGHRVQATAIQCPPPRPRLTGAAIQRTSMLLTRPSWKEQSARLLVQMCRYLHQLQGKGLFTQDRHLGRENKGQESGQQEPLPAHNVSAGRWWAAVTFQSFYVSSHVINLS